MPEPLAGRLNVATLNTRGIPIRGSRLASRYAAIGAEFEAGQADVVCFQEVFSYRHLRLLTRRMPSFRHVSYRPSILGPAGGLATFSRRPVAGQYYQGFGTPPNVPNISRHIRPQARLKGALVTRLADPGLYIVSTHPVANWDGDWSRASRFYPLHHAQLAALARTVRGIEGPAVVCGDFNVDRESSLFSEFMAGTGLTDAFGGQCPPTFRAEFLPTGKAPHCIDFILTAAGVTAESTGLLFTGQVPLPGGPGFVSDHIGLSARLAVPRPADGPSGRGTSLIPVKLGIVSAFAAIGMGAGVAVTRHAHRSPLSPWWDQRVGNTRLRRSDLPMGGVAALLTAAALRAAGQHTVARATTALGIGAAAGALTTGFADPLPPS
jgi:sphingomyelin phosphodiesterase 2